MKEVFKDIEGYEGMYQVSNLGRVKSLSRKHSRLNRPFYTKEKILKIEKGNERYHSIKLIKNKSREKKYIHRLIANAFIPNPDGKRTVNHINGIKEDNSLSNLEWCTHTENAKHAFRTGLRNNKGENHSRSKLIDKEVLEIREKNKDNKFTQKELAQQYNVSYDIINNVICGRTWKHI